MSKINVGLRLVVTGEGQTAPKAFHPSSFVCPRRFGPAILHTPCAQPVGWVKRSETQHLPTAMEWRWLSSFNPTSAWFCLTSSLSYATVLPMSESDQPTAKNLYLDVCALCRPFDDQQQIRIRLENSAVELILAHVRQSDLTLVVSPVHYLEIEATADTEERKQLLLLLNQEGTGIDFDLPAVRNRAEQWAAQGLGAADAAHVAFAEAARADFVTVDDRLLKQCRRLKPLVWCGTPQAYCDKENLQ
ncbi:MAG: hypothetical protein JXM69_21390 [Anaerolineae bacterium]|nr:hypothetical protein [Anaerolineae bacterium]